MSDVPLPDPWDYCYEWDGPYGTRKFSAASYNGTGPNRSVAIFRADQMHAHAAAVSADLRDENARLREANDKFAQRQEWWNTRMLELEARRDALQEALAILVNFTRWATARTTTSTASSLPRLGKPPAPHSKEPVMSDPKIQRNN